jgi:hypothetical protein
VRRCREIPIGLLKAGVYWKFGSDVAYRSDRDDMADLTFSRSTQQMRASGFAALLGLFAGLCAIFAIFVTLADWHDETTQAGWPIISAIVERADVVASARAPKDGGGTVWSLRYRVRYELDGEQRAATLTSRSVFSEADAAKLQSWAAQHRKGTHIDIRYDPSQQNRAAFASAEISPASGRTQTDLILFAVAAIACGGLLALARYLRAREARAAPAPDGAQRGGLAVGLVFAAMGVMLTGLVIHSAIHGDPLTADNLMGVPAGLMFVFAGILLGLPPEYKKWRNLLATLVITCFALTFDWVAFGPGERKFSGNIMGIGFASGETLGRALFGVCAVVLDIFAIAMWIGQFSRAFGRSTSPTPASEQGDQTTSSADSTA